MIVKLAFPSHSTRRWKNQRRKSTMINLVNSISPSIPGRYFSLRAFLKKRPLRRREKERRKRGRYPVWDEKSFWACYQICQKNEKKIRTWRIEGEFYLCRISSSPARLFCISFQDLNLWIFWKRSWKPLHSKIPIVQRSSCAANVGSCVFGCQGTIHFCQRQTPSNRFAVKFFTSLKRYEATLFTYQCMVYWK